MAVRAIIGVLATGIALAAPSAAWAESADYYRGGWRTDAADPHVYQFVSRGAKVTGFTCTQCADGTTLAPLEGTFDEDEGLIFTIRHLAADGATTAQDQLRARLSEGR